MLNENHSNSLPEKMDALDRLPGEAPFNKGAAWDRLQQRMETQAPVKRTMWYWWAAAAVLVVVMIPFLLQEKRIPALPAVPEVVYTPAVKRLPAPAVVVKTVDVDSVVTLVNGALVLNAHGGFTYTPNANYNSLDSLIYNVCDNGTPGPYDTVLSIIIKDVAMIQPPVESTAVNNDTPLVTTTATVNTNTRKMRVVHINDVGGDVIGNTYINPDHKQFRVAVGGRAGFASQIVSDKSSNNIPKN